MVLLHVVAPAVRVHPAVHPLGGHGAVEDVQDVAPLLDDRDDARVPIVPVSQGCPPLSA